MVEKGRNLDTKADDYINDVSNGSNLSSNNTTSGSSKTGKVIDLTDDSDLTFTTSTSTPRIRPRAAENAISRGAHSKATTGSLFVQQEVNIIRGGSMSKGVGITPTDPSTKKALSLAGPYGPPATTSFASSNASAAARQNSTVNGRNKSSLVAKPDRLFQNAVKNSLKSAVTKGPLNMPQAKLKVPQKVAHKDPHAPAAQYPTTQYDGRNEARYGGEVNLNELAGEQRVKSNANSRVNALQPKKSSYSIKGASASKSSNATASGSGSGNANGNEPVVIGSSEDEIEEFSDGGLAKREIFNSIDIKGGAGKGKGKANEDDGVVTGARRGKESAVRAADAVSKKNVQLRRVSLDSSSRINGSDDFEAAPDADTQSNPRTDSRRIGNQANEIAPPSRKMIESPFAGLTYNGSIVHFGATFELIFNFQTKNLNTQSLTINVNYPNSNDQPLSVSLQRKHLANITWPEDFTKSVLVQLEFAHLDELRKLLPPPPDRVRSGPSNQRTLVIFFGEGSGDNFDPKTIESMSKGSRLWKDNYLNKIKIGTIGAAGQKALWTEYKQNAETAMLPSLSVTTLQQAPISRASSSTLRKPKKVIVEENQSTLSHYRQSDFAEQAQVPTTRRSTRRIDPAPQAVEIPYDPIPADKVILVWPHQGMGSVSVTRGDQKRLEDGEFLNDTLIEYGLKRTLEDLMSRNPLAADQVHIFNSFFYKKLSVKPAKAVNGVKPPSAYESVAGWTRKFDLFKKKYIIVPINEHFHWYLAIIVNPHAILRPPRPVIKVATRTQSSIDSASPAISLSPNKSTDILSETPIVTSRHFEAKPDDSSNEMDVDVEGELDEVSEAAKMASHSAALDASQAGGAEASRSTSAQLQDLDKDTEMVDFIAETPPPLDHLKPIPLVDYASSVDESSETEIIESAEQPVASTSKITAPTPIYPSLCSPGHDRLTLDQDAASIALALELFGNEIPDIDECYVFTFDSLGSPHPPVTKKLLEYLGLEARDKKKLTVNSTGDAKVKTIRVPQQPNFCDCGLYLLHFVEKFLEDPESMTGACMRQMKPKSEEVDQLWSKSVVEAKRITMRTAVRQEADAWAEIRKPIEAAEALAREAKKKLKDQKQNEKMARLAAKRENGGNSMVIDDDDDYPAAVEDDDSDDEVEVQEQKKPWPKKKPPVKNTKATKKTGAKKELELDLDVVLDTLPASTEGQPLPPSPSVAEEEDEVESSDEEDIDITKKSVSRKRKTVPAVVVGGEEGTIATRSARHAPRQSLADTTSHAISTPTTASTSSGSATSSMHQLASISSTVRNTLHPAAAPAFDHSFAPSSYLSISPSAIEASAQLVDMANAASFALLAPRSTFAIPTLVPSSSGFAGSVPSSVRPRIGSEEEEDLPPKKVKLSTDAPLNPRDPFITAPSSPIRSTHTRFNQNDNTPAQNNAPSLQIGSFAESPQPQTRPQHQQQPPQQRNQHHPKHSSYMTRPLQHHSNLNKAQLGASGPTSHLASTNPSRSNGSPLASTSTSTSTRLPILPAPGIGQALPVPPRVTPSTCGLDSSILPIPPSQRGTRGVSRDHLNGSYGSNVNVNVSAIVKSYEGNNKESNQMNERGSKGVDVVRERSGSAVAGPVVVQSVVEEIDLCSGSSQGSS